ncbi:MAG: peptide-methionine (S)-S-oxide reductase MsrA [Candidatus Methanoplasma sp.]|jgi:methionine-S-sulfoxide reductase|nr:peptide-methionine (S)-S-oxide reductase MsrA [Candidatus Methanoplasma sp.]
MSESAVRSLGCDTLSEIYLAGGCFWGLEKVFSCIKGVADTECGYANGNNLIMPDYMTVCSGRFGYCEAVRVCYDREVMSLERILDAFFMIIDPTLLNRQGNDRGIQYRTGIYWTDEVSGNIVMHCVAKEKRKHSEFYTEAGPLENFFPAEDCHQKYLDRNPNGYCHIPSEEIEFIRRTFP